MFAVLLAVEVAVEVLLVVAMINNIYTKTANDCSPGYPNTSPCYVSPASSSPCRTCVDLKHNDGKDASTDNNIRNYDNGTKQINDMPRGFNPRNIINLCS